MIYLDNSATTRPHPEVLSSFRDVSEQYYANPSSIHSFGGEAEQLMDRAYEQAARYMKVGMDEIVFTSGGTEGNNMAVKGIAWRNQSRGKHIITTAVEHPSVLDACASLEKQGFDVSYLPVNESGVIDLDQLEDTIRPDTILISVMHVNSELGSVQPIAEIGEIARRYPKLHFHVDHVQGFGKVPLTIAGSGIDCCTISGHKIHGLKGTGILYVKNSTLLEPLFHGGGQQNRRRPGTLDVAGAVSLVRAMRYIKEQQTEHTNDLIAISRHFREQVLAIPDVKWNSPDDGAPHIMNISVEGLKPEVVIHALAAENIYISTKSACSSKQEDASRVMLQCGFSHGRAASALRISTSYATTVEDIDMFCSTFKKVTAQLREVMG